MEKLRDIEINKHKVEIFQVGGGVYKIVVKKNGDVVRSKYLIFDLEGYDFILSPSYLDNSVLVKFDDPVYIGGKSKKRIYVLLPIEVDVIAKKGESEILIEKIEPDGVKAAWFGELHNGGIYYFYESPVFGEPEEGKRSDSEVFVPIDIINRDSEERELEKLLIDSYQLSIYEINEVWISERVEVVIEGNEVIVNYTDEPPVRGAKEIKEGEMNVKTKGLIKLFKRNMGKLRPRFFNYG